MLAEQAAVAESMSSIPVDGEGGNLNLNESGTVTPTADGDVRDTEIANIAFSEQLSNFQHQKKFCQLLRNKRNNFNYRKKLEKKKYGNRF
jgi:hypothetical protein